MESSVRRPMVSYFAVRWPITFVTSVRAQATPKYWKQRWPPGWAGRWNGCRKGHGERVELAMEATENALNWLYNYGSQELNFRKEKGA
jgi:hypothetical protein